MVDISLDLAIYLVWATCKTANTKLQFKVAKFLYGIKDLNKEDNFGHKVDWFLMADVFAELINAMQNCIVGEN